MPRRPSMDWMSAVSSPHTNAPAPSRTWSVNPNEVPRMLLPQQAFRLGRCDGGADMAHRDRIFAPDVDKPLGRTGRIGGDDQPFDHAERIGFEHGAIHERARIAFISVADHVLGRAFGSPRDVPLDRRRETGAAPAAKPGGPHAADDLLGREAREARVERLQPVACAVVPDRQRVDLAAVLEHDADLFAGVGRRRHCPRLDRHPRVIVPKARSDVLDVLVQAADHAPRPHVTPHEPPGVAWLHVAVERLAVAGHDFDQRFAVAEPRAPDGLDPGAAANRVELIRDGVADGEGPARDAARTEADSNLDLPAGGSRLSAVIAGGPARTATVSPGPVAASGTSRVGLRSDEVIDQPGGRQRAQAAVDVLIDRHDRREAAGPDARDAFDGELPVRIGVLAILQSKAPPQLVAHLDRARHVAGRALADADDVLARWSKAELPVERRDTRDLREGDLALLAHPPQGRIGQVPVAGLDGLQHRYHRGRASPLGLEDLFDRRKVDGR